MGIEVKTNISSLKAQRELSKNSDDLQKAITQLSSGSRINSSADDAAGLAVSERMRARIKSLDVAKRNASDAISYMQTSEGSLSEITNMVIRMRELTSQAASDTVGNLERGFLDKEFQQLRAEVGRIVQSSEFNGAKILTGENADKPLQIFVGASDRGDTLQGEKVNYEQGADPDVLSVDLGDLKNFVEKVGMLTQDDVGLVPTSEDGGAQDLGPTGTNELMSRLDNTLNSIASYRATLGSVQSRLNSVVNHIDVTNENLTAARSRIVDADYAQVSAKFAQTKIMTQAGISVLTQANAMPDMILQLLR